MQTQRELKQELDKDYTLKQLTETYEDVAVFKMQQIRKSVEKSRAFLGEVSEVYSIAKSAYLKRLSTIANKREREKEMDFILRNRKTAVVLISANYSLLGNIILQAYKVFVKLSQEIDCELVIIGKIGRYLALVERPRINFAYFDLDDYRLDSAQIKTINDFIGKYQKILVVYPFCENVLKQVPKIEDISGGVGIAGSLASKESYFFEPSAYDVMSYFEGQILRELFVQKAQEAILARYAARLTIMDEATQRIDAIIEKKINRFVQAQKMEENKRLFESFAGIGIWRNSK